MTSREEVAKLFRKAGENAGDWCDGADTAFYKIDVIIGTYDSSSYSDFFNRLADLIDPTCRIVYVDESYSTPDAGRVDEWHYECSRCCYELSDGEMDEFEGGALPFRYCPNCGARVVRKPETLEQAVKPADDYIDNQTLALAT